MILKTELWISCIKSIWMRIFNSSLVYAIFIMTMFYWAGSEDILMFFFQWFLFSENELLKSSWIREWRYLVHMQLMKGLLWVSHSHSKSPPAFSVHQWFASSVSPGILYNLTELLSLKKWNKYDHLSWEVLSKLFYLVSEIPALTEVLLDHATPDAVLLAPLP